MAIWKDIVAKDSTQADAIDSPPPIVNRPRPEAVPMSSTPSLTPQAAPVTRKDLKESVIATGLSFEGKIDGSGHVRISGKFKGDVHVDGTLTVDAGAHLAGSVRRARSSSQARSRATLKAPSVWNCIRAAS